MSPRPRRTLAQREAEAITATTTSRTGATSTDRNKEGRADRTGAGATTSRTTSPAEEPRVSTPVWVSDRLWGQARAGYLRDRAQGRAAGWGQWAEEAINQHNQQNRHSQQVQAGTGPARSRGLWLTPTTRARLDEQIRDEAARGRATTRAALVTAALQAAVDRAQAASGGDLPPFTGSLPRGPRPR